MAKAEMSEVRKADSEREWMVKIGKVVERTRLAAGLNLNEFSDAIGRDARQVARWEKGEDHGQLATIFKVERFRVLVIIALAEVVNGPVLEIVTQISVRRSA